MRMLVLLFFTILQVNLTVNAQNNQNNIAGEWMLVSVEMKDYDSEKSAVLSNQYVADISQIQQDITRWELVPLWIQLERAGVKDSFIAEYPNSLRVNKIYQVEGNHLMLFSEDKGAQNDCPDCPESLMPEGEYQYSLEGNKLILHFEYTTSDKSGSTFHSITCSYQKK